MINDNIRKFRKQKGMSQEEMAVRLHVVRQTVSKWENGLSVPDAQVLIQMATLLEVTVSKLLGIDIDSRDIDDLTAELARLNEELANKNRQEIIMKRANEKRGLILFLSFIAMLISLIIKNALLSAVLSGICMLCGVLILYRNMALLTSITTKDMRIKTLRITTIVNIGFLSLGIVMAILTATDLITFTEYGERMFAMLLVACVMIFAGIVSLKLPFTRHTGLRLPWTVRDE
uniref:helix-turn-helix domain-containing protein n=1 Tax=Agathobacter sp. TaxID=2021311 RepID=UPI0040561CEF